MQSQRGFDSPIHQTLHCLHWSCYHSAVHPGPGVSIWLASNRPFLGYVKHTRIVLTHSPSFGKFPLVLLVAVCIDVSAQSLCMQDEVWLAGWPAADHAQGYSEPVDWPLLFTKCGADSTGSSVFLSNWMAPPSHYAGRARSGSLAVLEHAIARSLQSPHA